MISTSSRADKGFTLIELLVVIAIIGILSSVVLASLNTARNKASDTAIQSNLANTRAEAELFYSFGNTYDGVCALTGTSTIGDSVSAAEIAFDGSSSTPYLLTAPADWSDGDGACHATAGAWAAAVPMKTSNTHYCVDSTGAAKIVSGDVGLAASAVVCP